MSTILEFIKVFQSESTRNLFTEVACYWFATILYQRFAGSTIVYNPDLFHFATRINGIVYDITGIIDDEGYLDWELYSSVSDDTDVIIENCINLERR